MIQNHVFCINPIKRSDRSKKLKFGNLFLNILHDVECQSQPEIKYIKDQNISDLKPEKHHKIH